MLTVEQWNALKPEEQKLRADEMPDQIKNQQNRQQLKPEEIEALQESIKNSYRASRNFRSGEVRDLWRSERRETSSSRIAGEN